VNCTTFEQPVRSMLPVLIVADSPAIVSGCYLILVSFL
jgi:hypothetical protein